VILPASDYRYAVNAFRVERDDVVAVSHVDSVEDMVRKGRDLEKVGGRISGQAPPQGSRTDAPATTPAA